MGRTDLDWHLDRADQSGDRTFAARIADLRWELVQSAKHANWTRYNEVRERLNEHGANIPERPAPPQTKEQLQMGMFDKPKYLTGDEGFADAGDVFWLHNARLDGTASVNGAPRDQAKLLVSHEREGEKVVVYTSGVGIVNQVKRLDQADRSKMPMEVRLDQIPSGKGNPTNVLTPADQDTPVGASAGGTGDDF